ncbi:MAG: exodeoxyribonuclease VII small subunit [Deltaproteobacteria bacterium]|nr:exodeoxyribonuclease VII small subunit [Deltaproteobacteria bacterium]
MKFEDAISRIEEIIKKLETGEIPLEESLKLFEEGMNLINFCQKKLNEVEQKVEILVKNEGGEVETRPFDPSLGRTEPQM